MSENLTIEEIAFCIFRDRLENHYGHINYKKYWDEMSENSKKYYKLCAIQYAKELKGAPFYHIPLC